MIINFKQQEAIIVSCSVQTKSIASIVQRTVLHYFPTSSCSLISCYVYTSTCIAYAN
jgi:hypothetical protein